MVSSEPGDTPGPAPAPGHDPGQPATAAPEAFDWGTYVAWLVERHGTLAAVAEALAAERLEDEALRVRIERRAAEPGADAGDPSAR